MRFGLLLAATALGLSAAPALAADVGTPEPLPVPEVVAAAPTNDWTGFYLGALLGYSWGDAETDDEDAGDFSVDGVDGGAYAGANWQAGNFVFGAEADLLLSGLEDTSDDLTVDQGLNGSLRARAGIALDQFLLYGTGGAALTSLDVSDDDGGQEDELWGWTLGAGAEAMVTDNLTARVEYRYTDYEDKTFSLGDEGDVNTDFSTHSLRAGLGVKF
jgi:outer membrane immunogenic protein